MLVTLLVPLVLGLQALAYHRPPKASSCNGVGLLSLDTVTNFTLAALSNDPNHPAANDTGIPLVLGQEGAIAGATLLVLSTYASYPYNDFPRFNLTAGGLVASGKEDELAIGSGPVTSGSQPGFIVTTPAPAPVVAYCTVRSWRGAPLKLTVDGHADLFQLCPLDSSPNAQVNVFYNYTGSQYGPDPSTCYSVVLNVIV